MGVAVVGTVVRRGVVRFAGESLARKPALAAGADLLGERLDIVGTRVDVEEAERVIRAAVVDAVQLRVACGDQCAARSFMRRPVQLGQKPRVLQENSTRRW